MAQGGNDWDTALMEHLACACPASVRCVQDKEKTT